jgi:hypothetical protein
VPDPQNLFPPGLGQPFPPVLADRLQEPVTRPQLVLLAQQHRLVCQPGHQLHHVAVRDAVAAADRLGRFQVEPAGKDRGPRPQRPLARRTQRETPVDRGPQRALPRQRSPTAPVQQPEPVLQALQNLLGRQRAQPHRG